MTLAKYPLVIVVVSMMFFCLACPPQKSTVTIKVPLVAMTTSSALNGSSGGFLLWSSSFDSEVYYYFYLRNADGSIQLHKAIAADRRVFIVEDPNIQSNEDAFVLVGLDVLSANSPPSPPEQLLITEDLADFTSNYCLEKLEIHLPLDTIIPTLDASI